MLYIVLEKNKENKYECNDQFLLTIGLIIWFYMLDTQSHTAIS